MLAPSSSSSSLSASLLQLLLLCACAVFAASSTLAPTLEPTASAPNCSFYSCSELKAQGVFTSAANYGSKWICAESEINGQCSGSVGHGSERLREHS
jgi:hypothetical protein